MLDLRTPFFLAVFMVLIAVPGSFGQKSSGVPLGSFRQLDQHPVTAVLRGDVLYTVTIERDDVL